MPVSSASGTVRDSRENEPGGTEDGYYLTIPNYSLLLADSRSRPFRNPRPDTLPGRLLEKSPRGNMILSFPPQGEWGIMPPHTNH